MSALTKQTKVSTNKRAAGAMARACLLPLTIAAAVTLAACGGGGGGGGSKAGGGASHVISGAAAVGIPLVGTVTVKDANGVTRTTNIGSNGGYAVDVSGMTAPFVFRAEGTVGGTTYVVHSAASSEDVNGTINITPLTDLVLANIAGTLASTYFQNGDFSDVTKDELDAEAGKLKEKLLPMLQAIGVDSSIDLLRTPFTPLASALDTALDQIRITTDPLTKIATITNLITEQHITDDLTVKAAAETSPPKLDKTDNLNEAASDIPKIRKALEDFIANFATGLPAPDLLKLHLTDDFLDRDVGRDDFVNEWVTYDDMIGGKFVNIVIDAIDYTDTTRITAKVSLDMQNAQGKNYGRTTDFLMRKGLDGIWRLHGDQRALDVEPQVLLFQGTFTGGDGVAHTCRSSGLNIHIEDLNVNNNGGTISYIVVKGDGLPTAGVRFNKPTLGGHWQMGGYAEGGADSGNFYVLTSNCETPVKSDADIKALSANAEYTFEAFDAANNPVPLTGGISGVYKVRTGAARPMALDELTAASFPVISSPSYDNFKTYAGQDLNVSITGLNPDFGDGVVYLYGQTQTQSRSEEDLIVPSANGTASNSLYLDLQGLTGKTLRVSSQDNVGRSVVTAFDYYDYQANPQ